MKRYFILVLLATMFVACTTDTTEDVVLNVEEDVIYASIDEPECRVQLNDKCQTVWTAKDEIVVFNVNEFALYQFTGKTGDRSGSFQRVGSGNAPGSSYKFDKYYALYDYDNYRGLGAFSDGTPALFSNIPAVQDYLKDSYALHANIMVGTSEDGKDYKFHNLLGYLRLSITGNKAVSQIDIKGNDGETLAGVFYFPTIDTSVHGWYEDETTTITINCGSGVALSSTPKSFYAVVPPIELKQGLSVEITFTDGTKYKQSTSKNIRFERNTIQPMATFNTSVEVSDYCEAIIYYTGESVVVPFFNGAVSGDINWGDGNSSFFDEFTTYDYTDGAASHTIKAKVLGATSIEMESCEGVSKIDLSNF